MDRRNGGGANGIQTLEGSKTALDQGAEPANDKVANQGQKKIKRMYYMDWLRSSDVHTVVLLHCILTTDRVTGRSLNDPLWKEKMESFFRFLVQFGIPVFFLLSGMGSIFFDTQKKGFLQYLKNKIIRLLCPFILAVLVFLVPRLYISQDWETIGRLDNYTRKEWNIFKYYPLVISEDLIRRTGALWFLPMLFAIQLMNYPLIAWSQRRAKKMPLDIEDFKLILGQITLSVLETLFLYTIIKNKFDFWNYIMPANIIFFIGMCIYMGYQLHLQNLKDDEHGYAIWILLLGPVISIALNFLKPKIENKDFYGYGIMANYHSNFFAQGIVYQIWREKIQGHCSNYSKSALYPFFVVLSVLFYGVNFPGNQNDVGYIFLYPIYGTVVMTSLFTTGTWQVIYFLEYIMRKEADHIYNEKVFNFFTTGSLVVYLCHDLWISVIATWILHPNMKKNNSRVEGISFELALFIMIIGVEVLSNLTYLLMVKLYECVIDRQKRKALGIREQRLINYQKEINAAQEEEDGEELSQNIQDCGVNSTIDQDVEETAPNTNFQTKRTK